MGSIFAKADTATTHPDDVAFNDALHLNDTMLQTLRELGLEHKHLFALFQIFAAMDKDKSGEISMLEFFDYIDLTRSQFSEKAFSVMDHNGSGEVDFIEFVLAMWNYCSFNHSSLVRFAFDLYDVDGSGKIEHDEVVKCVRDVWGSAYENSARAHKVLEKLSAIMENTADSQLSPKHFQEFVVRHPMLLFPAFELQMEIQRKVLGERFWSRATAKRTSVDVAVLNLGHVKELTLMPRRNSVNLLTSVKDHTGKQLQAKVVETSSNSHRRGSGFGSHAHRLGGTVAPSIDASNDHNGVDGEADSATNLSEPKRVLVPAKREMRRQSTPTMPHFTFTRKLSKPMETKVIQVTSPKRASQDCAYVEK